MSASRATVYEGLLVLFALVFLGVMIASGGRGAREQFVAFEAAGVLQAAPDRVQGVDVYGQNSQWRIARVVDGWELAGAPLTAEASQRLTVALQYLHVTRPIRVLAASETSALAEYGLAAPRVKLRVHLADGRSHDFAFGDNTTVGGQQYVRVGAAAEIVLLSDFVGAEWSALIDALP